MDLTALLLACGSGDNSQIAPAERQLKHLEQSNYPQYLLNLVAEMGTETKPQAARHLAGLIIKNSLVAKVTTAHSQASTGSSAL
jgi:importin subunit beta-1